MGLKVQGRGKRQAARAVSRASRRPTAPVPLEALRTGFEARRPDGWGNNRVHGEWGAAGTPLLRQTSLGYGDGAASPGGEARPGARALSNALAAQEAPVPNPRGASDLLWAWGQFLDHDLGRTLGSKPQELLPIRVPAGDPHFDPSGRGDVTLFFNRSEFRTDASGVRQQVNSLTAFIDASMVYGSDEESARTLRCLDGTGRLRSSAGELLPFDPRMPGAPFFIAGDGRVNENVALTSLQTVFMREHNRLAVELGERDPSLGEDERYELARALVAAQIQHITYAEFLPRLLGPEALAPYTGYREDVNPGLENFFSAAAYRFGHSMVSPQLLRLGPSGESIPEGPLELVQAFNNPGALVNEGGIDPVLRGAARQRAQAIDPLLVTPLRNLLFGGSGGAGMDLAALNIQRGRDHGLPSYNQARIDHGLGRVESFAALTPDEALRERLAASYGTVDEVDAWVGGLAEQALDGAQVGPLLRAALAAQFERTRDGDRFWFQHQLAPEAVAWVQAQDLASVIRRNTEIGAELQDSVFDAP